MKKMLLVLGVAAAAMTSCTSDEVMEVNQSNLIQFESFVNNGTRGTVDVTNTTLTSCYVFGYHETINDFTNVNITGSVGSGKWTYTSSPVYWKTGQYYFGAYADGNDGELTSGTNVSFANKTLTFDKYQVSDDKDLIAALAERNVTGLEPAPSTVNLTFKHMLSKVMFTFTNAHELAGVTMDIEDLVITAMKKKGKCEYTFPNPDVDGDDGITWTLDTDATAAVTDLDNAFDIEDDGTYTDCFFVIPQNIADDITISFKVTYKSGTEIVGEKSYSGIRLNNLTLTEWKPGYVYNYTASLPLAPNIIEFSVTDVQTWDSNTIGVPDTQPSTPEIEF